MKQALTWLGHEFKKMLPAAVFFLVTFHMIAITEAMVMDANGLTVAKASTATVAALLVAKAILVVDSLSIARHFDRIIWHNIIWRTGLFYLVTLLFHMLEKLASVFLRPGTDTFAVELASEWVSWQHFAVVQMWLVVLISLFTLLRETIQLVGHDQIVRLITQERPT
ncbi:hypothetical protein [Ketobacter sp.]|uniref:hypothetical protein n=1 Tax=Ketobacter sp. TaxID=2083498 RepID=UPI000F2B62A6|nr:hypothetical protein [Ketobacter sp.]RLT93978.1 MAG: hypothetical protein D9N14_17595 [Ketobacter sp.]